MIFKQGVVILNRFFNKYFRDSYGWDKFSTFLSIIGLILLITKFTFVLGGALIIYSFVRGISRNIYGRQRELENFKRFLGKLNSRNFNLKESIDMSRKYKIFKCPNCSQKLRVPRKQGNITITCKRCGTEFKKRT